MYFMGSTLQEGDLPFNKSPIKVGVHKMLMKSLLLSLVFDFLTSKYFEAASKILPSTYIDSK